MRVALEELVARHSAYAATPLTCHHSHAPHEWTPYLQDGQTIYPSKEEAEYTAVLAFAIAVAASWWAGRVGRAKFCMFHGCRNSNVSEPANIGWTWTPEHYGSGRWRPSPWG